ncbi:hypothetical protein DASC09_018510 [Saccharomycopsis crataegensis]|uniref:ferric-chelate reductase (NADPH) n=1 Tax=Saccharomycopsis crataegensis TaxID=43959 RepID=A0AAV5QIM2_9ASCO|nr:hypothetical protein DASC09_018510 [Saccharomycopsis crataegensis]
MTIPYKEQYYVEQKRNSKFEWLSFAIPFIILIFHGIIIHWIPYYLRNKRDNNGLTNKGYFKFLKFSKFLGSSIAIPTPWRKNIKNIYIQPSLHLGYWIYFLLLVIFSFAQTADITYIPRHYVIGKRLGKLATGQTTSLFLFLVKNDFLSSITAVQPERLIRFHIWVGRTCWLLATMHLYLCASYWLDMGITIMIYIPPQYFGMISYASCSLLTWASFRFIRKLSFEFFLIQHRVLSALMMLFLIFHNSSSRLGAIISVHLLVLDKIVSMVLGMIQKAKSPSMMISKVEVFDEETVMVTIPMHITKERECEAWWSYIIPQFGTWKAGQYIMLNINSISLGQWHPFTICSLPSSGKIKLLIRKKKGFTRKLLKKAIVPEDGSSKHSPKTTKIQNLKLSVEAKIIPSVTPIYNNIKGFLKLGKSSANKHFEFEENSITFQASIQGPYGANFQKLITFDSVLFMCAGSGGSVAFPICCDLLREIQRRDSIGDFGYRPLNPVVNLLWSVKKEANIIWYKHIIDELIPFLRNGKLSLTIHITSANNEINIPKDCDSLIDNSSKEYGNNTSQISDITYPKVVIEKTKEAIEFLKFIKETGLVDIQYSRIDIKSNIASSTNSVIKKSTSSSQKCLAVVGCGPAEMTNIMKQECQKNIRIKDSPDIYCFFESF